MFQTQIMDSYSNQHGNKLISVKFRIHPPWGAIYGTEVPRRPSLNLTIALTCGITKSQKLQTHIMGSYSNPHRKNVSSVKFEFMHQGVPFRGPEVSRRPSL